MILFFFFFNNTFGNDDKVYVPFLYEDNLQFSRHSLLVEIILIEIEFLMLAD